MTYNPMYVVINEKAIAVDELGNPIICDLVATDDREWVDWDSADTIDWLDLPPTTAKIYHAAVNLVQTYQPKTYYVK
jgi:hypothetical protein